MNISSRSTCGSRDESRDELVVPERVSVGMNGLHRLKQMPPNCPKDLGFVASSIVAIRQSATFTRWKPKVQSLQRPPLRLQNLTDSGRLFLWPGPGNAY